ncbi:MAG: NADH-quinone oxidoreductase subunit NuoN, partial [Gammaproteobacteria bacterium]
MSTLSAELMTVAPELTLMALACVVLVAEVFYAERYPRLSYWLSQATLVAVALLCIALYPQQPTTAFSDAFVSDGMSAVLKVFSALVVYFVFFYTRAYLEARSMMRGEYFILGLFAVLGMMVMVSARSLLTVYLGLELLSLSLYAMVALNRDSRTAAEAAMKYFVLGALASGMLLYGMSLLYGVSGTLNLVELGERLGREGEATNLVQILGLVFVVVGVAFKFGAVPFHMWVPDVYEGSPTAVTMFIGTAPKLAAFGMLIRLLVDGMSGLDHDWTQMLALMAVASMALGNIVAIAQTNLKRMLAYSTISHVGFIFLGVIAGTRDGYAASMFYVIAYALMSLGAFGMIVMLGRSGFEADRLDDFRGLARRGPWFALMMLLLMLSLAGMPPFLGFWAKWSVLREVVAADVAWLAVVAVAFAVIGLFYYLRIIRLMYFDEPEEPAAVEVGSQMRVMISTNALLVLALGV